MHKSALSLRIFKILKRTRVEGPGERLCIWVQGCSRCCKGCAAQNTWDEKNGETISIDEIFSLIKKQHGIEGVTFLGGEPFEQAKGLCELAKMIKGLGLSVLTFTGYYLEDLTKMAESAQDIKDLLENTDLLIDGPFEEENYDISRPWVGSNNKRYVFLSDRYKIEDIKYEAGVKNKLEVRIDKNGFIFVNGMGDFKKIEKDLGLLGAKN